MTRIITLRQNPTIIIYECFNNTYLHLHTQDENIDLIHVIQEIEPFLKANNCYTYYDDTFSTGHSESIEYDQPRDTQNTRVEYRSP